MSSWNCNNTSSRIIAQKRQEQLQKLISENSNQKSSQSNQKSPQSNQKFSQSNQKFSQSNQKDEKLITVVNFGEPEMIKYLLKNDIPNNESCLDLIDAILYINLEHRLDRKEHIIDEIKKIDPFLSKTHRIDAVLCKENGALGCSLSHIKALEIIKNNPKWKNIILLEDDFTFYGNDISSINMAICHMLKSLKSYDMILLGIGVDKLILDNTQNENIKRVLSAQTTSGYIVNRDYIYTLLSNYIQSSNNMKEFGWKSEWCLDQYWKKIMPISNWYTFKNRIAYQYENYSDIEGKVIAYNC